MTTPPPTPLAWFITGASQGLGLEIARAALARGDMVLATTRRPETALQHLGGASDRLIVLPVDLHDAQQINNAAAHASEHFGRIDVLVNNAGHGLIGAVEEASDQEIRDLFEINVLALLRVTRAVLPHMRARGQGHIVNMSSIGGLSGLAGFGIYNATKFAVEGLSEALAQELAPLNIRVTIVEPGPFRTNFLADSMAVIKHTIPDYAPTSGATRAARLTRNGEQPGDPRRAADAIIRAVTAPNPPLHLVLGPAGLQRAEKKLDALRADIDAWREISLATDFT